MIQTEEAKNNGNTITNRYRTLVDASSPDLLSTTLNTVLLQIRKLEREVERRFNEDNVLKGKTT